MVYSTQGAVAAAVPAKSQRQLIDTSRLHCYCQTRYDPKKFYVACDLCFRWFHGKCVGIGEKRAKSMATWACRECSRESEKSGRELLCLCRTAYDERQFYVGCDQCEGWYHPRCVGITQEDAERMGSYFCPKCRDRDGTADKADYDDIGPSSSAVELSDREDVGKLHNMLKTLQESRNSWPFRHPVDLERYPTYTQFVKRPMDLSLVRRKLSTGHYDYLYKFAADVALVFDNARLFNPKDSPIYQCANILEKRFRDCLNAVKQELLSKRQLRNEQKRAAQKLLEIAHSSSSMIPCSSSPPAPHFGELSEQRAGDSILDRYQPMTALGTLSNGTSSTFERDLIPEASLPADAILT